RGQGDRAGDGRRDPALRARDAVVRRRRVLAPRPDAPRAGAGRSRLRRSQGVLRKEPPARREAVQRLPRADRLGRQGVLPPEGPLRAVPAQALAAPLTSSASCFFLFSPASRAKKKPSGLSTGGGGFSVKLTAAAPR